MPPVQHVKSGDGTRIAYRASGEGEPLVCVHGSATSGADWMFAAPFLRERFTIVAMDRRGRGESEDGPDYAIEREAEDVLAVLEAVGGELLVGHSYGALCSMLAAERTDHLRRLVLYEPPVAVAERLAELQSLIDESTPDELLAGFMREAGVLEEQLELIRASPAWPVLLEAVPALPRELRAGAAWPRPAGPIDVPALFLVGGDTDSPVYLDGLDEVQAIFPNSRRELIPGQRHIAHVLAAAEFAALVTSFCAQP